MVILKNRNKTKAFTLVELSIVLIIIGLIIGVVTVGQELLDNARITSFKKQLTNYDTAVSMFKLKYDDLPGDMGPRKASAYGFVERSGAQYRGDGNGMIRTGFELLSYSSPENVSAENALFWRDLSDAGFIEEKFAGTIDGSNQYVHTNKLRDYLPHTNLPSIGPSYISLAYINYLLNSHAYFVVNSSSTDSVGLFQSRKYFSPSYAYMIDQKFDDGLPESGNITVWVPPSTRCPSITGTPIRYNVDSTSDCSIVFKAGFDEQ